MGTLKQRADAKDARIRGLERQLVDSNSKLRNHQNSDENLPQETDELRRDIGDARD
jgi:hypothetical protein